MNQELNLILQVGELIRMPTVAVAWSFSIRHISRVNKDAPYNVPTDIRSLVHTRILLRIRWPRVDIPLHL